MIPTRSRATQDAAPQADSAARGVAARADVSDAADLASRTGDEVDDSGLDSFPASDPPSWWSGP